MKKNVLCVLVLLLVLGIAVVFAASFKSGTYALVNYDGQIRFYGGDGVSISSGGDKWDPAGKYLVNGNRVIVTLRQTSERAFRELSGVTFVLSIGDNGSLYDGEAEWVRIGN
jgi:hypothetical protein